MLRIISYSLFSTTSSVFYIQAHGKVRKQVVNELRYIYGRIFLFSR